METALKVSVCMATFNGARWVVEMVESILPQLDEQDELVISDDNSSDQTCELIEAIGDRRIRLLRQAATVGVVANFERAMRATTGELLFLADQDDRWHAQKVAHCRKGLRSAELVVHDAEWIDAAGQRLGVQAFAHLNSREGVWRNLWRNSYMGCCMALRRELFEASLPWPKGLPMHDWWLALVALRRKSLLQLNEPLIEWRHHTENSSATGSGSNRNMRTRLRDRLLLWRALRSY